MEPWDGTGEGWKMCPAQRPTCRNAGELVSSSGDCPPFWRQPDVLTKNDWIKNSAPCLKEQIVKEPVEHGEGRGCQFSSCQDNKCGCTF